MRRLLPFLFLASVLVAGCGSTSESGSAPGTAETTPAGGVVPQGTGQGGSPDSTPPASTGGENVQVLTGGAGGVAPVTGGENLGSGSGGGVGMAAKDSARGAATKVQGTDAQSFDDDQAAND